MTNDSEDIEAYMNDLIDIVHEFRVEECAAANFCNAIRAKEKWFFKILDGDRSLALKWANEAGFLNGPDSTSEEDVAIRDAIEELKGEARRIQIYDYTIRLDRAEVSRSVDFHGIDSDVLNALKYVQGAQFAIDKPELRQHVGAFVSDDIVPISLHRELVAELGALAAAEPKDFHPGTSGKVQDLIHPSLYPFVSGITYATKPAQVDNNLEFHTSMEANEEELEFTSIYSWIPSVFQVSEDGLDVHIESYINGLGPREQYPMLYRLIEKIFLLVLPRLERTLRHKFKAVDSPSVLRWYERSEARESSDLDAPTVWTDILAEQALAKKEEEAERLKQQEEKSAVIEKEKSSMGSFYGNDDSTAAVSRRGGKFKVIVKQITFSNRRSLEHDFPAPNGPNFSHHDHFHITFTADYNDDEDDYLDYPSDWEEEDKDGNLRPMSVDDLHKYIDLGAVPTAKIPAGLNTATKSGVQDKISGDVIIKNHDNRGTGRIITFPNWVQHRVTSVKNVSSAVDHNAPPAKRKILCFFLVDEDDLECNEVFYHGFSYSGMWGLSVLTTADVPFQRRCNDPTLHFLLPKVCLRLTGKNLPAELVDYIINSAHLGLSREMAEDHRRRLMQERKVQPKDP